MIHWIKALGHPLIEEVQVFDQYRGASIPEGKKSLAYTISYRSDDRTLTDDEVNDIHESITSGLVRDFDAELRK